jgi:phospholipase D1/2
MEMMYTLIAEALKEERLDGIRHPTDYLNFFCLGNREPGQQHAASPVVTPNDRQVIYYWRRERGERLAKSF